MLAMQKKPVNILVNASGVNQKSTSDDVSSNTQKTTISSVSLKNKSKFLIKNNKYFKKINKYLRDKYCTEHKVVGIEIQPDVVRVAEANEVEGKWKLERICLKNTLNTISFESIRKNKKVYVDALRDIFVKNKILNKNVAVAIPASLAITKTISLPLMTKENLAKATKIPSFWQNLVQISENLNEYSIYYRITKENPAKKEMDILFVAVKQLDLNVYKEIIKDAGLNLVLVDVGCFPIINLSKLTNDDTTIGAILKIGKDENYLEVLEDGKPNIYDIFVPENEKAYLSDYIEHQTFQQRFSSQLKHIISKHEDKFNNKLSSISVISSENNIDKLINDLNSKIDTIKFEQTSLFEKIDVDEKIWNGNSNNKSAFAIVTGLATRKIEIFSDNNEKGISDTINLLPNASEIKNELKNSYYSKIFLGITVAACCLVLFFYSVLSASKYQSNYNEILNYNTYTKLFNEKNKIYNELNSYNITLNQLSNFAKTLPVNQEIIINGYKEIAKNIPDGVWLKKISIDKNVATIYGQSYEEPNIISFAKAFEGNKIIKNVSINNLKSVPTENGTLIKEFIISADIGDIIVLKPKILPKPLPVTVKK
jgi:type IV pilus assembly protein PilN